MLHQEDNQGNLIADLHDQIKELKSQVAKYIETNASL